MNIIVVSNKAFNRPLGFFKFDPDQLSRLSAGILIKAIIETKKDGEILAALAKEGITPITRSDAMVEVNDDGAMKFFDDELEKAFSK